MDIEIRSIASELRASSGRLSGMAIVYDSFSQDLGGFHERVRPGALSKTLASSPNIRALVEHDAHKLLGRSGSKTLKLENRENGLYFELDLPNVSYAQDIGVLVDRGDIAGVSFGFRVNEGGDLWEYRNKRLERDLTDIELLEISIVSDPAYAETSVAKRSMEAMNKAKDLDYLSNNPIFLGLDNHRRYLDTY